MYGQQELIAAPAPDPVRATQPLSRGLHQPHQHLVASQMAVGVVDRFEVVQIDHEQGQRTGLLAGPGGGIGQRLLAAAPVQGLGERIEQHTAAQITQASVHAVQVAVDAAQQPADLIVAQIGQMRQALLVVVRLQRIGGLAQRRHQAVQRHHRDRRAEQRGQQDHPDHGPHHGARVMAGGGHPQQQDQQRHVQAKEDHRHQLGGERAGKHTGKPAVQAHGRPSSTACLQCGRAPSAGTGPLSQSL
ncbi:hypothetical protein D3C71_1380930 [compost metagenome]